MKISLATKNTKDANDFVCSVIFVAKSKTNKKENRK